METISRDPFEDELQRIRFRKYALYSIRRWKQEIYSDPFGDYRVFLRSYDLHTHHFDNDLLAREAVDWLQRERGNGWVLENLGPTHFLRFCEMLEGLNVDPELIAKAEALERKELSEAEANYADSKKRFYAAKSEFHELGGTDSELTELRSMNRKLHDEVEGQRNTIEELKSHDAALLKQREAEADKARNKESANWVVEGWKRRVAYLNGLFFGVWVSITGFGLVWSAIRSRSPWELGQISAEDIASFALGFAIYGGTALYFIALFIKSHLEDKMYAELSDRGLSRWPSDNYKAR